jgi:hypothetical protein
LIKVGFFLNLMIGFLFGIFSALIFIPMARVFLTMAGAEMGGYDAGSSLGMLFFMPFMMGILAAFFNTLFMVLVAACYNLVARVLGGLEIQFESVPDHGLLSVTPVKAAAPTITPSTNENVVPPPPPPFRAMPVVPVSQPEQPIGADLFPEIGPEPISTDISATADDGISPVVEPHTEPDEDGPRQENP